jgi:hypothetical protein
MEGCAFWNTNNTEQCVGVAWVNTIFGPEGASAGCQCYYKWAMPGNGTSFDIISSAKLVNDGEPQSVNTCLEFTDTRRTQLVPLAPRL